MLDQPGEASIGPMGFKTGVLVGVAIGFYLGTKASPERAAQVRELGDSAVEKARAMVELGVERARDITCAY